MCLCIKAGVQPNNGALCCSRVFQGSVRGKDVSFFRIPKVVTSTDEKMVKLSKKRREGFLSAISRKKLADKILKNDRICSRHFICGKPADLSDENNPDWLPSLNMGHANSAAAAAAASARWLRRQGQKGKCQNPEDKKDEILNCNTPSTYTDDTLATISDRQYSDTHHRHFESSQIVSGTECVFDEYRNNYNDVATQTSICTSHDMEIQVNFELQPLTEQPL